MTESELQHPIRRRRLILESLSGKLILACCAVALSAGLAAGVLALLGIDLNQRIQHLLSLSEVPTGIGIWQDHPRYGWENRPNAVGRHTTEDFDVMYTIDSSGNRAIPVPKDPAGKAVLLGCSFTFGYGVKDDESYAAILANTYWPRIKVINRSANGWGTGQAFLVMQDLLQESQRPDLIIYSWIEDHGSRNYLRENWLESLSTSNRKNVHIEIENGLVVFKGIVGPEAGLPNNAEMLVKEEVATVAMVHEMNRMSREAHVPFVVVMLNRNNSNNEVTDLMHSRFIDAGVTVLDARETGTDYFPSDTHPKPQWHRDVARRVAEDEALRWIAEIDRSNR